MNYDVVVTDAASGPESRARQVPEARARADGARERARQAEGEHGLCIRRKYFKT